LNIHTNAMMEKSIQKKRQPIIFFERHLKATAWRISIILCLTEQNHSYIKTKINETMFRFFMY